MQAIWRKIMGGEDEEPESPKGRWCIDHYPEIVVDCLALSWKCFTNPSKSVKELTESLKDWDPEELKARSTSDMPLALNYLLAKAQNIPVAEVQF